MRSRTALATARVAAPSVAAPLRRAFAPSPAASAAAPAAAAACKPAATPAKVPEFQYQDVFAPAGKLPVPWKKLPGSEKYVKVINVGGREVLQVDPKALTLLANQAMIDIAHLLRPAHLASLASILKDPEASSNDRFVALELLKNANIASHMVLPGCQDTGTAIIQGKKGQFVWTAPVEDAAAATDANGAVLSDEAALSKGVYNAYTQKNLRYSQVSPSDMFTEKNTGSNLPAQIELYTAGQKGYDQEYNFLFIAKGGGSANKTFLEQKVRRINKRAELAQIYEFALSYAWLLLTLSVFPLVRVFVTRPRLF